MSRFLKYIFFAMLMAVLCLPYAQQKFNLINEKPLGGAFVKPNRPLFNFRSWWSGDYQEQFAKAFNTDFGFHNSLIRIRNQFYYSVLHASAEPDFILDRNNYLHARNNIRSVTGDDFKGADFFDQRMKKLKVVSDSLKAHGIPLLLVIAPGRANFLRNQLPLRFHPADSVNTNYYWLNKKANEYGIDNINFHQYFINIKDTVKYPLFYKLGVHWSVASFTYACDSIIKKLDSYHVTKLAKFTCNYNTIIRDSADIQDIDQTPAMNVFKYAANEKYYYPYWRVDSVVHPLPKLLCVGDSYFLTFLYQHMLDNVFDYQFWFYHTWVFPQNFTKETHIEEIDYWKTVFTSNYVLIVTSEYSWDAGGFDFVDNAYDYFMDKEKALLRMQLELVKKKVTNMNDYIKNTPDYYSAEIDKASQRKITIAEMTMLDAFYMVELDNKQKLNDEAAFQVAYNKYKDMDAVKNYVNTLPDNFKNNKESFLRILAYMMAIENKSKTDLIN